MGSRCLPGFGDFQQRNLPLAWDVQRDIVHTANEGMQRYVASGSATKAKSAEDAS